MLLYNPGKIHVVCFMLAMSIVAMPVSANSGAEVGKVIISIGKSTAQQADGQSRKLKRRAKVYEGDILTTGKRSRLQVRFKDGQLVALKAESEFRIDEYKFSGKEDGTESASMSLLKGGMRAITGAIGKTNKDAYKLKTPVATLGVRGTHYGLVLCTANCGVDANGVPRKPGLYGGVVDGEIVLNNNKGGGAFSNDQYFFIADTDSDIVKLLVPPEAIFGQEEAPPEGGDTEEIQGPDVAGEDGSEPLDDTSTGDTTGTTTTTEPNFTSGDESGTSVVVVNPRFDPLVEAPPGSAVFVASVDTSGPKGIAGLLDPDKDSVLLGSEGGIDNLLAQAVVYDAVDCNPCIFDAGTATLTNVGGNGFLGVNWGTWNDGYTVYENGTVTPTNNRFSFIYSPNLTMNLPTSGVATYTPSGGTPYYDQNGNSYSLGSTYIDVDFGLQKFTGGQIQVIGPKSFDMTVSPTDFSQAQQSINLSGTCSGCAVSTATGDLEGAFIGPNAEGIIGSARIEAGADVVTGVTLLESGM